MKYIDCLNSFIKYLEVLGKSTRTIKEYKYDLVNYNKYLQKQKEKEDITLEEIKEITINDLHEYIGYVKKTLQDTPPTIARKCASIRTFFKYLETCG